MEFSGLNQQSQPFILLINVKRYFNIYEQDKGLGSQTGFFGPVFFPKVKNNLQSYKLFFLLFEHLCVSDMQKYLTQM